MKKALITGIYGQDGSYLGELLSNEGTEVHGIIRENLSDNSKRIKNILNRQNIKPIEHITDLNDYSALKDLLLEIRPDEIYHMAAYHVSSEGVNQNKEYFDKVLFDYNVKSTSNILSICFEYLKNTHIVTAGSCLMFDNSKTKRQNEETEYNSKSLYGLAKITENSLVKYYRSKRQHSSCAILYNHESSRRSINFVTRKIINSLIKVKNKEIKNFTLGNLEIKKDWGWAKDYANAMILMARAKEAKDYVLSSGELHTIKEFIEICVLKLGLDNYEQYININSSIIDRKIEGQLFGDCSKIEKELNWKKSLDFEGLIDLMIKEEENEQ
ncbi:GDP-mannose 4,6-dehydratase [bacterium]|nr:GDP-mannose 4,6-dehydratase [bacterium]